MYIITHLYLFATYGPASHLIDSSLGIVHVLKVDEGPALDCVYDTVTDGTTAWKRPTEMLLCDSVSYIVKPHTVCRHALPKTKLQHNSN